MKLFIGSNNECDVKGAQVFINQIHNKPNSILGLATGSTPVGIYEQLVSAFDNNKVSFAQVKTFNLDEYVGLAKDHECSYNHFMQENLFKHVDIHKDSTNLPNGMAQDLKQECKDYEEKIQACGGVDLQILGLGLNGHIGFNEPGTEFGSTTQVIDLTGSTIDANSRFFDSSDDVPRQAISMGIKTIMNAQKIMLVAKGSAKADIVNQMINGPITPNVPASILQLHPNVLIILDNGAASKLENR